jgi:PAS domain S-box-containing protein
MEFLIRLKIRKDIFMDETLKKPEIPDDMKVQWQRIVDLMAGILGVPTGLIMRTDPPQIEVFRSSNTKGNPYRVGERANLNTGLYCEEVMKEGAALLVRDATKDPKWAQNPDIELGMTYYFGFPIQWPDGEVFGTICVLDKKDNPQATACKELLSEFKAVIERDLLIIIENENREKLVAELELHRTQFEQIVAKRTGEWQVTFDAIQDLVMILDNDFRILRVNKSTVSFLGQPLEQILGNYYYTLMYGTDVHPSGCPIVKASRSKQHEEGEIYLDRKDIWLLTSADPIIDDKGDIVGFIKLFKDITERKRAEKELKEVKDKLDRAQELAHIGSWYLDIEKDDLQWSDETYRMFGLPKGLPLTYEKFLEFVHPEDKEYVDKRWMAALNKEPYDIEHRIVVDGKSKWVRETAQLTFNKEGKAMGGIGIVQDITERKQAEKEIRRLREEYTHIARVSAMGELAASLAHELKQPLAAIRSNAQAAQRFLTGDKPDIDELHEVLKDIIEDNRRADDVIGKLRKLMQKGEIQATALNINSVVRDVIPLINSYEIVRNISLEFELDERIPLVTGDRIQLQQVILNLILNSSEALMNGEVKLRTIVLRTNQEDTQNITLSVKDNGSGIEEKAMSLLFEPFYTTKQEGLGMGLAISRTIIEGHGGRLWAENNPDSGATFYFTIPIAKEGTRHEQIRTNGICS